MGALRFETVQSLFDAFETAPVDIGGEADDTPVLIALQSAIDGKAWDRAISLCAYLLPRREAVWWGCQSLRHIRPEASAAESAAIEAAEAWVKDPGDDLRRAALRGGMLGDGRLPATWMALAAGWSGGSVMPPEYGPAPVEPYQTARAVRAGLLIALVEVLSDDVASILTPCFGEAFELLRR
jgi:hypothetical protein